MSTSYRFTESFSKKQVKKAMKELGLKEFKSEDTTKESFCITDGESYLWAYCGPKGEDVSFCRYGVNYGAEDTILAPLADKLQTGYLSEYDEGYFEEEDEPEDEEIVEEVKAEKPVKKTKKKSSKLKKK